MDKLHTVLYDSGLGITEQDTSTVEAYSTLQNYYRAIAPYNTEWIPYVIFYPTNASSNVGVPAEYMTMKYIETVTVDGSSYYAYETNFPDAVVGSARATKIDVTMAFIQKDADLIGVNRYDETDEEYNDTTYIAAQLLIDYPSAVSGNYVRVFNTETDWSFDGTEWTDTDDITITSLVEHRATTVSYALRKGTSTSRPTHSPTNTETIIAILNDKINSTIAYEQFYTKTDSNARFVNVTGDIMSGSLTAPNVITDEGDVDDNLLLKVDKTQTIAEVDLQDNITKEEMKTALDIDDAETDIDNAETDIDNLETANMFKGVAYDTATGILTFTLYDDTTTSIDFPLEQLIVSGDYDETTKDLTLTLADGSTIVIPLDDILTGLATQTYVDNLIVTKVNKALAGYNEKETVVDNDTLFINDSEDELSAKKTTAKTIKDYIIATMGEFDPTVDYSSQGLGAYSAEVITGTENVNATYSNKISSSVGQVEPVDGVPSINEIKGLSLNSIAYAEDVAISGTINFDSVLNNKYYDYLHKTLITGTGSNIVVTNDSGAIADMMIVMITGTPLLGKTASAISLIITTYFEGEKDYTPSLTMIGKQLFDKSQYTSTTHDYIMPIKPSTEIVWSESVEYKLYDSSQNLISTATASTVTTTDSTYYISFDNTIADSDTFMLIYGSTLVGVDYVDYISSDISWDTTLRSVGTVQDVLRIDNDDYVVDRYVGKDTTVVKSATSWSLGGVLTTTQEIYKDLSSLLDYTTPINNSTKSVIAVKIGTINYTVVTRDYQGANDEENNVSINTANQLRFRVNKTTYPTSADFEAYLQANDVTFIYELDTPLLANEIVQVTGSMIQENPTTVIQNHTFASEVTLTHPTNINGRVNTLEINHKIMRDDIDDNRTLIEDLELVKPSNKIIVMSATDWSTYTRVTDEVYGVYDESTGVITWYYGIVGV